MTWNPTEWLSEDGRFEITTLGPETFAVNRLKRSRDSKSILERECCGFAKTFVEAKRLAEKAR